MPPGGGQGYIHKILSEKDLSELQSTGQLVVADWFATWCKKCTAFESTFQKLAEEYEDVLFCKIDVDEMDLYELAGKQGIRETPTFKVSCRCLDDLKKKKNNSANTSELQIWPL